MTKRLPSYPPPTLKAMKHKLKKGQGGGSMGCVHALHAAVQFNLAWPAHLLVQNQEPEPGIASKYWSRIASKYWTKCGLDTHKKLTGSIFQSERKAKKIVSKNKT